MARTLLLLTGLALAGCLVGVAPVRGDIVADDSLLLSQWMTTPFRQQDKLYTYLSSSGISNGLVHFVTNAQPGQDIHTITLTKALSGGTFQLRYTIEIVDSPRTFYDGSLGVNVDGFLKASTVTETIQSSSLAPSPFSTTMTVTNGGSAGPNLIQPGLTKLWVRNDIVVPTNGQVNSFSNTFTQTTGIGPEPPPVPEPTSVVLLAGLAGTAGIGLIRLRRRRRATSV